MATMKRVAVCAFAIGVLGWGICRAATAQHVPAEMVPAAAPHDTPKAAEPAPSEPYRREVTYYGLQAGWDAYEAGERFRRWAIDRQLELLDHVKRYHPQTADYVPDVADLYAFGGHRAARRAYRRGYAPVFTPWPYVPGRIYGYGYFPRVQQPIGHERIWTGPNGYIYAPRYAPRYAPPEGPRPTPAPPETRPQEPPAEPIPPADSGPREF